MLDVVVIMRVAAATGYDVCRDAEHRTRRGAALATALRIIFKEGYVGERCNATVGYKSRWKDVATTKISSCC